MGLSKEEQRDIARLNGYPLVKTGIKRFVKGHLRILTKKQNSKLNKAKHKPPKIFYGYNTNK